MTQPRPRFESKASYQTLPIHLKGDASMIVLLPLTYSTSHSTTGYGKWTTWSLTFMSIMLLSPHCSCRPTPLPFSVPSLRNFCQRLNASKNVHIALYVAPITRVNFSLRYPPDFYKLLSVCSLSPRLTLTSFTRLCSAPSSCFKSLGHANVCH